jgi:hypothetical protein
MTPILVFLMLFLFCQPVSAQNPFNKLVDASKAEMAKRSGRLKIALDWPEADTVSVFPEFKKSFPFIREILYTREGDVGPFANYLIRIKRGEFPEFDIMHVAGEFEILKVGQNLIHAPSIPMVILSAPPAPHGASFGTQSSSPRPKNPRVGMLAPTRRGRESFSSTSAIVYNRCNTIPGREKNI